MSKAREVVECLGGEGNIVDLEPCITRLRVQVSDPTRVDQAGLKAAGAHGVVVSGRVVQVVVGPEAEQLAEDIAETRS
jgi:PTS system N-acetylglucosamine-specific IIB component